MQSYESVGGLISPVQTRHLETQSTELQRRYNTLTKRIAALDTDIGRELDSERKLVLQERRSDLAAERDQVQDELTGGREYRATPDLEGR